MNKNKIDEPLKRYWNADVDKMPDDEIGYALEAFRDRRSAYERKRSRRKMVLGIVKYAAVFVLPLLTALVAWNYSAEYYAQGNELTEYYVPDGSIDSLLLSDNTRVIVNSGTSIIYPQKFNSRSLCRNVYVNGSCHFAVTKDRNHPFVVNMGSLKVRVLGTHFSVNSYNEEENVIVTLEEGLVKVSDLKQSVMLYPNEQLIYNRSNGKMIKQRVDALTYNSWVHGELNFVAQPLSAIIHTLERSYNVKIEVASGVDMHKRYTMNFIKNESIESVMKILATISGNISYSQNGNKITVRKNQ